MWLCYNKDTLTFKFPYWESFFLALYRQCSKGQLQNGGSDLRYQPIYLIPSIPGLQISIWKDNLTYKETSEEVQAFVLGGCIKEVFTVIISIFILIISIFIFVCC